MVVSLWSRDFFPPLYFDPRFRPLLLKFGCNESMLKDENDESMMIEMMDETWIFDDVWMCHKKTL